MGVDEITFTEHYDDYTGIDTNLKTLDVSNYYKQYLLYKNDKLIKTNFGIEINFPYITTLSLSKSFSSFVGRKLSYFLGK
jgi:hypothetical protein